MDVSVPWNDKPIPFPDDATPDEMNEAIKQHPNYPTSLQWRDMGHDIAKNFGGFAGTAIQSLPFDIGKTVIPEKDTQTKLGTFKSDPELEQWKQEHPKSAAVAKFTGGTLGYVPAAMATEAAGGGMAVGTGIFSLYNMLDKFVQNGKLSPEDAKNSIIEAAAGMGLGKLFSHWVSPNVKPDTIPTPNAPEPIPNVIPKEAPPLEIKTPAPSEFNPKQGYTGQELKLMGASKPAPNAATPQQTTNMLQEALNKGKTSTAEQKAQDLNDLIAKLNSLSSDIHSEEAARVAAQNAANNAIPAQGPSALNKALGAGLGFLIGHYTGYNPLESAVLGSIIEPNLKGGAASMTRGYRTNQLLRDRPQARALLKALGQESAKYIPGFNEMSGIGKALGVVPQ